MAEFFRFPAIEIYGWGKSLPVDFFDACKY